MSVASQRMNFSDRLDVLAELARRCWRSYETNAKSKAATADIFWIGGELQARIENDPDGNAYVVFRGTQQTFGNWILTDTQGFRTRFFDPNGNQIISGRVHQGFLRGF